jgi:hypothetical protein
MSRLRHEKQKKASGGVVYSGAGSNVAKEAMERKHGGKVEKKEVEKPEGKKPKARMDKRPRRASGGRVGSDKSPFSSAARPGQNTEASKP